MGLRDSPYRGLQWQTRLKLEVYGNRRALDDPFDWDRVIFNLPGSKGYQADLPWVMKICWDGELAAEVFTFMWMTAVQPGPRSFCHGKRGKRMGTDVPGEECRMPRGSRRPPH